MIPESIIERAYDSQVDANGKKVKRKDVNRSPNVTSRLEGFISEHNDALPESSPEKYMWFSDTLSNRQRQKRAKNIIRSKLGRHLKSEWLDGSLTFNMCQLYHSKEVEECIEDIITVPVMGVYTQTERNWAIRRLIEDLFANRRRTYLKSMKEANKGHLQNELGDVGQFDNGNRTGTERTHQMTETEAALAATEAFTALETDDMHDLQDGEKLSSDVEAKKETVSDIDEQIMMLKNKKRRLKSKKTRKSHPRNDSDGECEVTQGSRANSKPLKGNAKRRKTVKGQRKNKKKSS